MPNMFRVEASNQEIVSVQQAETMEIVELSNSTNTNGSCECDPYKDPEPCLCYTVCCIPDCPDKECDHYICDYGHHRDDSD